MQIEDLANKGWAELTFWECELSEESNVQARLTRFLTEQSNTSRG